MRRLAMGLTAAGIVACCVGTGDAAASVAQVRGGGSGFPQVSIEDQAGEVNDLAVAVEGKAETVVFEEEGSPIKAAQRCVPVEPGGTRVECRADAEFLLDLWIKTGLEDDRVTTDFRTFYRGAILVFGTIDTGPGADVINAGKADEEIKPGAGDDEVHGGAGVELFLAGRQTDGADLFDGEQGGGHLDYSRRQSPLNVDLDGVADDGAPGENDELIGVSGITAGDAADTFTGDGTDNAFLGRRGADVVRTRGGSDLAFAGRDADTTYAGPGRDWVIDSHDGAVDTIDCGPGDDTAFVDEDDVTANCERVRTDRPFGRPVRARLARAGR